jgi:hypothetical protein
MARDNAAENPHRSPVPVVVPSSLPSGIVSPDGQARQAQSTERQAIVNNTLRDRATPRPQENL